MSDEASACHPQKQEEPHSTGLVLPVAFRHLPNISCHGRRELAGQARNTQTDTLEQDSLEANPQSFGRPASWFCLFLKMVMGSEMGAGEF